ncbi:hypothetical protein PHYSODRAFT_355244 [Phytophthora sojae]|uniref:Uncharacterized protein n=1 Tax=Phytophthora sojae (strain P6497) TaxID=1094619 RepID=G4ZZR2_PHYSP|nr:hypothetical protein PHYSODRAFT_355244 [Phytophthora sojae]EGZ10408.1 hypothetical protein PHYSODRAFT_355244 [Phytophthora sojae]|eukprot:XP_009533153.1 hypothetical protein PHYSODRAFT_355244 [Phytophthora sojae]
MRTVSLLSHADIAATLPTLQECIRQLVQFVQDEHEQFLAVRALERREREDRRQQVQQRGQEQLDAVREEHDRVREPTFDWAVLLDVLSHLVVHSLLGSFQAFAPLSQRLSTETQQSKDAIFGDQFRAVLQREELLGIDAATLQPNSRFRSWASMVEWSNVVFGHGAARKGGG